MATQSDASQTLPSTEGAATSTTLQLLLLRLLLDAFVLGAEQGRAEAAFHITTIFYAQLSGFLCICGAAYVKNYTANPSLARESVVQVFALHLTVLFLPASPGA